MNRIGRRIPPVEGFLRQRQADRAGSSGRNVYTLEGAQRLERPVGIIGTRLSQIDLRWPLFVSSQIEVIFLKRGVYKLTFEDIILSNCLFVVISLLRGYFCKIMCHGQQSELNLNLLKSTKMESLEVLVVLEVSKYSLHILWSLTAIFQTFIRE